MAQKYAFGIDLGTSTSEIAVFMDGQVKVIPQMTSVTRSPVLPSLVAVNRLGELVVGEDARPYVDVPGWGVREVKRLMGTSTVLQVGNHTLRPEEVSALILKQLAHSAYQYLGVQVQDVVLSVPANFSDAARQATLNAGQLAGLNVIRLINEPTAAALAFGFQNIGAEGQLVIFDFGGGTLDITVLEMMNGVLDVKCSYGDPHLGGKDFDEALVQLIISKFRSQYPDVELGEQAMRRLKNVAEQAKIALSNTSRHPIYEPNFAVRGGHPIDLDIELTREEFEAAVLPLLERARGCLKQALLAKDIRPSSIEAVLLVGGTTYIPAVRQLVTEMLGKVPRTDVDPDLAVAMGAAVRAASLQEMLPHERDVILTDVCPIGLGIEVYNREERQSYYDPLILPNTTIPYSVARDYRLLEPWQKTLEINLYQDRTGRAKKPEDAEFTGIQGFITDIPPSKTGEPHPVKVDFGYDANGLIRLTASIPATGQSVTLTYNLSSGRMTPQAMQQSTSKIEQLWGTSPYSGAAGEARAGGAQPTAQPEQREERPEPVPPPVWSGGEEASSRPEPPPAPSYPPQYQALINRARQIMSNQKPKERKRIEESIRRLEKAISEGDEAATKREADQLVDLLFDLEDII